jgi:hypothetical protein
MKDPTVNDILEAIKEWKLEISSEDRLSIKFKYLEILYSEVEQLKKLVDAYKKMFKDEKREKEILTGKLLQAERNWFESKLNIKG